MAEQSHEMREMMKQHSFRPRPVVESRWKEKKYVPEVMFDGRNYVLGPPHSTHEDAMKLAEEKVELMIKDMLAVGHQHVAGLKLAKE